MTCVSRNGVIRKMKQAFSDVNSRIILIFSQSLTSIGLIIKIVNFLPTFPLQHLVCITLIEVFCNFRK